MCKIKVSTLWDLGDLANGLLDLTLIFSHQVLTIVYTLIENLGSTEYLQRGETSSTLSFGMIAIIDF